MKRLCQISLTIFAICTISVFLLTLSTFGQQKIVCPPNKGISADGSFSNEPLKKDLVTGVITRLDPVDRAIAELACNPPSCDDGIVNGVEECDDGNTTNGDGCSGDCTIETPV